MQQQASKKSDKKKKVNVTTSVALIISAIFHGVIFLLIGTVVIFEGKIPQNLFTGDLAGGPAMDAGPEAPPMLEEEMPQIIEEAPDMSQAAESSQSAMSSAAADVIVAQSTTVTPAFTMPTGVGGPDAPIGNLTQHFGGNSLAGKGPGVGGAGTLTRFGFRGGVEGGALQGKFYDYKLDRKGKPIRGLPPYGQIYEDFAKGTDWGVPRGFDPYSPKVDLFLKTVLFEGVQDVDAGKAFDAPETRPGRWLAHYFGNVQALQSGKFRLGGWGDNYLVIGLNGEFILDACDTSQLPRTKTKISINSPNIPGKGKCNTFSGPVFELTKGEIYRMDIIMGDRGGIFTAGAFVLEHDEDYQSSKVFKEYPMLVFDDLSTEEYNLYPFVSSKALQKSIFRALR